MRRLVVVGRSLLNAERDERIRIVLIRIDVNDHRRKLDNVVHLRGTIVSSFVRTLFLLPYHIKSSKASVSFVADRVKLY